MFLPLLRWIHRRASSKWRLRQKIGARCGVAECDADSRIVYRSRPTMRRSKGVNFFLACGTLRLFGRPIKLKVALENCAEFPLLDMLSNEFGKCFRATTLRPSDNNSNSNLRQHGRAAPAACRTRSVPYAQNLC